MDKFKVKKYNSSLEYNIRQLLPKYPRLFKLVGPVAWSHFKYKGRNIHTFGDLHEKPEKVDCDSDICMTITQLFKYISERSVKEKQSTNFYLEHHYVINTPDHVDRKRSYLSELEDEFKLCLMLNKTKCPYYPYAKYHYVDVRSYDTGFPIAGLIFTISGTINVKHQLDILHKMDKIEKIVNEFKLRPNLLFDMYIDKDNGKKISEVFAQRMKLSILEKFKTGTTIHKVKWQLKNIDSDMALNIRNFAYAEYTKLLKELFTLIDNDWSKIKSDIINHQKLDEFEYFNKKLFSVGARVGAVFMDTYYLARLFRSMEWDKSCKLFVTYVGDYHRKRYDKFFKSLPEAELINKSINPTVAVNITGLDFTQTLLSSDFKTVFGEDLFM